MAKSKTPLIVVEQRFAGFYVLAEWGPKDHQLIAFNTSRDLALAEAGKAAIQWSAPPVVEREANAARQAKSH